MINALIGILLLITFIGLVVYVMKGGNIMIGFLVMSILWAIIGGIPINTAVNDIFSKSAEAYGGHHRGHCLRFVVWPGPCRYGDFQ